MNEKLQSNGECTFCGLLTNFTGMKKHLSACPERRERISKANKNASTDVFYHLQVRDSDKQEYWLDLEIKGSASLKTLDSYLRAIWLECCGHLSDFYIGGWDGRKIPKTTKALALFETGMSLTHFYDFGTTSETIIKISESRKGAPLTHHPIFLMARNRQPLDTCIKCGQAADWLCMECLIEDDNWGTLCDKHLKSHPHNDYEPTPLVNSPRLGMCGYDGPAEPPY